MLISDLWGIGFHAVVVFGLCKNLLFKSVLGHCGQFTKYNNLAKNFYNFVSSFENLTTCINIVHREGVPPAKFFGGTFLFSPSNNSYASNLKNKQKIVLFDEISLKLKASKIGKKLFS